MSLEMQPNEMLVSWMVDDIEVPATLARPEGTGPFPAVIFVAGSGPTDRNWNSPLIPGTNGSAALLAQALAGAGFLSLRYDKRPSGAKGQENAMRMLGKISMQSHMDELASGVRLLAARPEVAPGQIFALTNSEGAVHALNYQASAPEIPFAGLVLTAPPGRTVGAVGRSQIAEQLAPVPGGDVILAAYDRAMEEFLAGQPVQVDESLPEGLKNLIKALTTPYNQPFARELWTYDAIPVLERVSVPVLILIGKKDVQVDWQADGQMFEAAAQRHPNITLVYLENANHVLKHEPRPRSELTGAVVAETYSGEGVPLDADTIREIVSWLRSQERDRV